MNLDTCTVDISLKECGKDKAYRSDVPDLYGEPSEEIKLFADQARIDIALYISAFKTLPTKDVEFECDGFDPFVVERIIVYPRENRIMASLEWDT